jgi:hypothetical protein
MHPSSEDNVFASMRPVKPQISSDAMLAPGRTNALTGASARWRTFAPASIEEDLTYRNWRRATLVLYAVLLCVVAAAAIAIGPGDRSGATKSIDIHLAIASAVQRSSR